MLLAMAASAAAAAFKASAAAFAAEPGSVFAPANSIDVYLDIQLLPISLGAASNGYWAEAGGMSPTTCQPDSMYCGWAAAIAAAGRPHNKAIALITPQIWQSETGLHRSAELLNDLVLDAIF